MKEIKCPVCGKNFIYLSTSIFKLKVNGKVERYCGNSCYNIVKKKLEQNRKYNRRGGY